MNSFSKCSFPQQLFLDGGFPDAVPFTNALAGLPFFRRDPGSAASVCQRYELLQAPLVSSACRPTVSTYCFLFLQTSLRCVFKQMDDALAFANGGRLVWRVGAQVKLCDYFSLFSVWFYFALCVI